MRFLLTSVLFLVGIAVWCSFVHSYVFQKTLRLGSPVTRLQQIQRHRNARLEPLYARKPKPAATDAPAPEHQNNDENASKEPAPPVKRAYKKKAILNEAESSIKAGPKVPKEPKPKKVKATAAAAAPSKTSRKLFPSTTDESEEDDISLSNLLAEFAEDKEMYDSLEPDLVSIEEKLSRIGGTMGNGGSSRGGSKRVRDNMKGGASGPPDDFEDEFDLNFDEKEMEELLKGIDDVDKHDKVNGKDMDGVILGGRLGEEFDDGDDVLFSNEDGSGFVLDDLLTDLEDLDIPAQGEEGTGLERLGMGALLGKKGGLSGGEDKKRKMQRGRGVRNYEDDLLDGLQDEDTDGTMSAAGQGADGNTADSLLAGARNQSAPQDSASNDEESAEDGDDTYFDAQELRRKRKFATYSLTGKNKRGGKKNSTVDPLLNSLEEFQRLVTIMDTQGGGLDNIEGVMGGGAGLTNNKGLWAGDGAGVKNKASDDEADSVFTFDRTASYGAGNMYIGEEGETKKAAGGTLQDLVRRVDEEVEERSVGSNFVDLRQLRKSGEFQDSIGQVWNPILQYYRGGHPDIERAKQNSLHAINASVYRYNWANTTRADEIVSQIVADNFLVRDNMTIGHSGTQAAIARSHSNIHIGAPDFSTNYSEPSTAPPSPAANGQKGQRRIDSKYAHLPSLSTNDVYAYIQEPRKEVLHVTTFVYLENSYNKTLLNCAREMMAHVRSQIQKEGWGHRVVFTLMCAESGGSERLARGVDISQIEDEEVVDDNAERILTLDEWMESKDLRVHRIVKNKEERDVLVQAKKDYKAYIDSLSPATLRAHELRRMQKWEKWYTYRKAKEDAAKAEELKVGLAMGIAGRARKTKKIFNPYPKDNIQMWVEGMNVKHLIDGPMIRELWGYIPQNLILGQKSLDALVEQVHMSLFEETGGDMGNGQGHSISNQHLRFRIEGGSLAMKRAFNTQNLRKEFKALIHG